MAEAPLLAQQLEGTTVLVTGGAGFVGSNLAVGLRRAVPGVQVIALDNLRRRGAELTIARLAEHGVDFVHGDVRCREDLELAGRDFDVLIECSAEASVLAGYDGSPTYLLDANLVGALNCFEAARRRGAAVVFLSTSRVYPIATLNGLAVEEDEQRFDLVSGQSVSGASDRGIAEQFPLQGIRSLYGSTKLAAELVLEEFGAAYGLPFVINRCGVIAGPWQMGKVDQGVFSLWMARHVFGGPLAYKGWGGAGKQVRDVLHVDDLCRLVLLELTSGTIASGKTYNVGGGRAGSLSLSETTMLCEEITGRHVPMARDQATHPSDVRLYYTDNARVTRELGWRPEKSPRAILEDLFHWMRAHERALAPVLAAT